MKSVHEIALRDIRQHIESVVVTAGEDRGVVLLSNDAPTHYDAERKCNVFDHENFSPLGDALVAIYDMTAPVAGPSDPIPDPAIKFHLADGKLAVSLGIEMATDRELNTVCEWLNNAPGVQALLAARFPRAW
jgi:hypothetical protein